MIDEGGEYYLGVLGDANKPEQPGWVEDGETLEELSANIELVHLWGTMFSIPNLSFNGILHEGTNLNCCNYSASISGA